jgi:transcriptional regulator with XRE-family HTH domain
MEFDKNIFISNIETLIEGHSLLSQKEFNKRIGYRDAITRWKNGESKPSIDNLLKIATEFQCGIEWLLTGKKFMADTVFEIEKLTDRIEFLEKKLEEIAGELRVAKEKNEVLLQKNMALNDTYRELNKKYDELLEEGFQRGSAKMRKQATGIMTSPNHKAR